MAAGGGGGGGGTRAAGPRVMLKEVVPGGPQAAWTLSSIAPLLMLNSASRPLLLLCVQNAVPAMSTAILTHEACCNPCLCIGNLKMHCIFNIPLFTGGAVVSVLRNQTRHQCF